MGGGKRKSQKPTKRRRKTNNNQSLFIEGGILAGFDSPFTPFTSLPGKNNSRKRSGNSGIGLNWKSRSTEKSLSFGYDYPSLHSQGDMQLEYDGTVDKNVDMNFSGSKPLILLNSRDNKIVAYEDLFPSIGTSVANYSYEYSSGFVLGESSHTGLGLSDEQDVNLGVSELSSGVIDEDSQLHPGLGFAEQAETRDGVVFMSSIITAEGEESIYGSSSQEIEEEDADTGSMDEDNPRLLEESAVKTPSRKKNSSFVSIGGMRLYTKDISDDESGDENDVDEEDCSDNGCSSESSESDDSEDSLNFSSDVDEEVMEDYLDGIGGSKQLLKSKWLASQNLGGQQKSDDTDDDSSSDQYGSTLKKLGGVARQEASMRYGLQKKKSKKKSLSKSGQSKGESHDWSSPLDDLMFVRDRRRESAKKKHSAGFPQSWPSQDRIRKKYGWYPGEKKKQRKEMIAVKRRERMLLRGVDLEQINSKLKQMVLNNSDILSFQPMHSRDCSQVQRLAAIYRLKSGCQGSGKKRFVIVSRTQYTSMPSATDEVRLEKLIGASKDDTDFTLADTSQRSSNRSAQSKSSKNLACHQGSSTRRERRSSEKKPAAYASQPVSFVSSGVMESDSVKADGFDLNDDSTRENKATDSSTVAFGTFEVHTTGFGSKMMAKMGYVEGGGLGKEGKGMSQPIEVIQRPKSLGLGMTFDESISEPAKAVRREPAKAVKREPVTAAKRSGGSGRKPTPALSVGSFEKHTKGFGSKMMAKMGFIEGTGLGRASQGIVTPLSAVRRPKARGLGAEN